MKRLRNILIFTFTLLSFLGYSQQDIKVNKETLAYKDTLLLDVYTLDKAQKSERPLLILVHGGGFASGKRDGDDEAALVQKFIDDIVFGGETFNAGFISQKIELP